MEDFSICWGFEFHAKGAKFFTQRAQRFSESPEVLEYDFFVEL